MIDGTYRVELSGRTLWMTVKDGRVTEADPGLERAIGRPFGEVRRWAKQRGGFLLRVYGERRIARSE